MEAEKKYIGYGYHGGGRKATGIKRVSVCISGQAEQVEKLKELAALERKTVSAFVFDKTGVNKMTEKKWFVANDDGELIGHDMSEVAARALAAEMQDKEPDANWEAMNGEKPEEISITQEEFNAMVYIENSCVALNKDEITHLHGVKLNIQK